MKHGLSTISSYVTGIIGSTASTFVLFLVFSYHTDPASLGIFAVVSAVVAIVVRFVDGTTSQRIAQWSSTVGDDGRNLDTLGRMNLHRGATFGILSLMLAAYYAFVEATYFIEVFIFTFAQGLYACSTSTRVLHSSGAPLLRIQLSKTFAFFITAGAIIFIGSELSVSNMLVFQALALMICALPFFAHDSVVALRFNGRLRDEAADLYVRRGGRQQLTGLALYQSVNSVGASADTLIAGMSSYETVARYQMLQRPLLALSALNVAIGQYALNRIVRNRRGDWNRKFWLLSPILVVWPALGAAAAAILPLVAPEEYALDPMHGAILGFVYGIEGLMQLSGSLLLAAHQSAALFAASSVQLAALLIAGIGLVPWLGVLGLALALCISRLMGFATQYFFLRTKGWQK